MYDDRNLNHFTLTALYKILHSVVMGRLILVFLTTCRSLFNDGSNV